MAKIDVWTNQTANVTTQPVDANGTDLVINGIAQIDIAGVLDGADVLTQYLHSNNASGAWIQSTDGSWLTADLPTLPDGALIQIEIRKVRFVLQNVGLATDITLSVSYG